MGLSATLANALLRLNVAQQALSVTANNVANANTVRVRDCPDGTVAIFKGPQRLAGQLPPGGACARQEIGRVTTATRRRPPQQRSLHVLPIADKTTRSLLSQGADSRAAGDWRDNPR
jgi:hypothetical protein